MIYDSGRQVTGKWRRRAMTIASRQALQWWLASMGWRPGDE